MDALRRAIDLAGGPTALAEKIGVGQSAVSNWLMRGNVPPKHCAKIQEITGVRCHELRPDIFPAPQEAA